MNIQELEDKHYNLSKDELNHRTTYSNSHTKLSVEFAIEILNSIQPGQPFIDINDKIQELKKYLDEKS